MWIRQQAPTPSSSNLLPRTSTLRRRASEPTSVLEAFLQRSHHHLPYTSATPQVTHPRDIRNVPIEWLDNEEGVSNLQQSRSLHGPIIEEINNAIDTRAMSGHASFSVVEEPTSDVIIRPILNPFGTQNSTRLVDANDSCNPNAPIVRDISESNDKT